MKKHLYYLHINVTSKEQKTIQEEARRKKITVSGLLREIIADNSGLLDKQHNYDNDYNAIDQEIAEAFNGL